MNIVFYICCSLAVAPLIGGPDFNAFAYKAICQPAIPPGVFSHSVNYVQHGLWGGRRFPPAEE
jgi:hypothetical protein